MDVDRLTVALEHHARVLSDAARYDSGDVDATIRTDPVTLDFWLWGRRALPDDAVEGDRSVADLLRAVASGCTQ